MLPVEGSGLAPGLSQRKLIADPCGTMFAPRHPPSTKLPSLGPLPRFVLCHQTTIRWSVSSAGRAVVVSRPRCLCHCLPMFVRHTSSKEIARCTSVRPSIVDTSHDPTALAFFFAIWNVFAKHKVLTDRQGQAERYRSKPLYSSYAVSNTQAPTVSVSIVHAAHCIRVRSFV